MSIVNDSNYPPATPLPQDYTIFVRDSDGSMHTVTMQVLANLLQSLSSQNLSVDFVSSEITLTTEQLVVTSSGSAFDLNLPAAATNEGRGYRVFNSGTGSITLVPNGSDTIGLSSSLTLAQGESVIINSDGLDNWATFGTP